MPLPLKAAIWVPDQSEELKRGCLKAFWDTFLLKFIFCFYLKNLPLPEGSSDKNKRKGGQSMEKTLYEILEVLGTATEKEIKAAFRKLSKRYHPDDHPGDAKCERRFKEVSEAYSILSDRAKREEYDKRTGVKAGKQPGTVKDGRERMKQAAGGFDFQNADKSFERFFGFHPDTKDIVDESKMDPEKKKKNPLDAGDLFEAFMGIKR